jgi:hypothetical protein
MSEDDPFEGLSFDPNEFNPREFFKRAKQNAILNAGAKLFGESQLKYIRTLQEGGISQEDAIKMTVEQTLGIIKGISSAAPMIIESASKMYLLAKAAGLDQGEGKKVPGSAND